MITVGRLEQEIIFFVGPPTSGEKPILEDFVKAEGENHISWLTLLDNCLGTLVHPEIIITDGGKRGYATKSLHLDLVKTITRDGSPLYSTITPVQSAKVCFAMCDLFDVDWVDLWYTGLLGNCEIRCDRKGKAIQFLGGGRKIELDVPQF